MGVRAIGNVTLETLHAMMQQVLDEQERHSVMLREISETIGRIERELTAIQRQSAARRVMREEQE